MKRLADRFRGLYGNSPLHMLAALASFAIVGIAVSGWFNEPAVSLKYILIWFVGAILAHDLVLLPLYSALDRLALLRRSKRGSAGEAGSVRSPGWVYVRIPLLLSGLLLLVFGAEIFEEGDQTFHVASGQHQHVYLTRYLIIVAVSFVLSALAFVLRSARDRRGEPHDSPAEADAESR
jgi:Na+/melibiose symporter-like transporter